MKRNFCLKNDRKNKTILKQCKNLEITNKSKGGG